MFFFESIDLLLRVFTPSENAKIRLIFTLIDFFVVLSFVVRIKLRVVDWNRIIFILPLIGKI